jgi:cell wall-associated NlpC family hydrolase
MQVRLAAEGAPVRRCGTALLRAFVPVVVAAVLLPALASPALAKAKDGPVDPTGAVIACATLGQGTTGQAVATIQTLVAAPDDGDFGPQTAAALQVWQTAQDIPATGIVDAATWAAMPATTAAAACAQEVAGTGFTVGCAVLSLGDTGPAVAVLESALKQSVDGVFTAATGQALEAAQQVAGLPATGVTNRATWKLLGLTKTAVCTPTSTGPALPKDYKAQQKVRKQAAAMAATLATEPGTTTNKIALAAVTFAKSQIGKPYVWGGTGPNGYDCSGLQMTSYEHAGLTLPRVAADQYAGSGPTVPLDQAQAGDLLFFASDVLQPSTIYHVAMYVGAGQILDAPYTGAKVGIRPLWTTDLLPVAVRPVAGLAFPLRSGATGWSVTQLQEALVRAGQQVTIDGGFGPTTKSAVKALQTAHQINPSGVVGLKTWLALI